MKWKPANPDSKSSPLMN